MQILKKCDALIFDLDGTLWDASQSSALAWSQASDYFGINRQVDAVLVRKVSGLPFDQCLIEIFGTEIMAKSYIPQLRPAKYIS